MLRGTAKLLALLRPPQLTDGDPAEDDWYGNLLWLDGRKRILLTHAGTQPCSRSSSPTSEPPNFAQPDPG